VAQPPEGVDRYAMYMAGAPTVNRNGNQGVETDSAENPSTKICNTSQAGSVKSMASDVDQTALKLQALISGNVELNQTELDVEAAMDERVSLKRSLAEAVANVEVEIAGNEEKGEPSDVFVHILNLEDSLPVTARERVKSCDKTARQALGETVAERAGETLSTLIPAAMVNRGEGIVGTEVRGAEENGRQEVQPGRRSLSEGRGAD